MLVVIIEHGLFRGAYDLGTGKEIEVRAVHADSDGQFECPLCFSENTWDGERCEDCGFDVLENNTERVLELLRKLEE